MYNSTITPPPIGRECRHPCCGPICRKKKETTPRKPLNRVSPLKKTAFKPKENTNELSAWFEARRLEMTGICQNCHGKSCRDDDKYYKFSIAHLFAKSVFKSVATHESNWLELCYFGLGCHPSLDNGMISLSDLHCFDSVIEKFERIYPHIAQSEKRRIPEILRPYIHVDV